MDALEYVSLGDEVPCQFRHFGSPDPMFPANRVRPRPHLPLHTDFSMLFGKAVLVLADEDNLRISTTGHGLRLSFDLLLRRLAGSARSVSPWAGIPAGAGDSRRENYL